MKSKTKLFSTLSLLLLFNFNVIGQATEIGNNISAGSYLGSSNSNVIFKSYNVPSGILESNFTSFGYNTKPNSFDTVFGAGSLSNQNNNSSRNSVFGFGALINTSGCASNAVFGADSMDFATVTGGYNSSFGYDNLSFLTSGYFNVALGTTILNSNTTGESNIGIGKAVLGFNTNGSNNIAIGRQTLDSMGSDLSIISNNNVALGAFSGNLVSGSNNLFLGYGANKPPGSWSDQLVIETGSSNYANPLITGDFALNTLKFNALLEINNLSTPNIGGYSGLRFTNLTNTNPAYTNPTNKVLSVNATGDVYLVEDKQGTGAGVTSNVLSSASNIMTSNVAGIISSTPIVSSVTNTITSGQLVTTVNGISSPSIVLPTLVEVDGSVTNELQTLSELPIQTTGTAITLSNGGGTVFVNGSETKVQAGVNVTVTGNGTIATPYIINSTASNGGGPNNNIYNTSASIIPANFGDRVVSLNNNNLVFNTTGTNAARNKVYIGNTPSYPTTTGNYKLYVEGGILTEKVKVALRSTANWADSVFSSNYKLTPLNEVERFVKTNQHLPGITSAENLVKDGLDLAEMQAKQMAKIEELTLYAIEQNKQIAKQNKEIEELKVLVNALVNKK
jgi:trimeric autotransporter adhesin